MANVYVYRACSGCVDTVELGREREREREWMGSVGCGAWTVDKSSKTVSREKTRERERERRIVSRGQSE